MCENQAHPPHLITIHDLCSIHSYFDRLESKSETAKEIIRTIEDGVLMHVKLHKENPTEPNQTKPNRTHNLPPF